MRLLDERPSCGYFPSLLFLKENRDEQKNISAKQYQAEKIPWLSGPFPDQEWPGCPAPQKSQGKKEISSLAYPPSYRLTRRPQFTNCYDRGRRFFSKNFILFVSLQGEEAAHWRLGLAVSKKVGNAVLRNRVKRLLREFFRQHQHEFAASVDIVVVPKRSLCVPSLDLQQVRSELGPLMDRIVSQTAHAI